MRGEFQFDKRGGLTLSLRIKDGEALLQGTMCRLVDGAWHWQVFAGADNRAPTSYGTVNSRTDAIGDMIGTFWSELEARNGKEEQL